MEMNRRAFMGASGAMILTAAQGKVFGANERVRLASIGIRGRGFGHVKTLLTRDDVEYTALCDVDAEVLETQAANLKKITGKDAKTYRDIRDLLADDNVDAVTIAAPNHWHVLAAIWALQAGKDVYVEKPISHTVWEGRQLTAAAAKYGRVIQHGTQRRSEAPWQRTVERARSGIIGDIYAVRLSINRFREPFSHPMEAPVPEGLDWTLWQGPATEKAFSKNYVHYDWHWFWHYGNGEIGNNGPHSTDIGNWIIDKGLPVKTESSGGIYGYTEDARETPNTQLTTHTFADGTMMVIDVRNRYTPSAPAGVVCQGTEGYQCDHTFYAADGKVIEDDSPPVKGPDASKAHFDNFIEAVKKGDPDAVPATVEQGHVAASLCHLGNVAYRLGRTINFDPKTETCPGDEEANALLTRTYREGFEVPKLA